MRLSSPFFHFLGEADEELNEVQSAYLFLAVWTILVPLVPLILTGVPLW